MPSDLAVTNMTTGSTPLGLANYKMKHLALFTCYQRKRLYPLFGIAAANFVHIDVIKYNY